VLVLVWEAAFFVVGARNVTVGIEGTFGTTGGS
jgi:hypothetical protein